MDLCHSCPLCDADTVTRIMDDYGYRACPNCHWDEYIGPDIDWPKERDPDELELAA